MRKYLLILFLCSCGTKVGNPGKPTDSTNVTLPSLDIELASELELALAYSFLQKRDSDRGDSKDSERGSELKILADRINRLISETDQIIDDINNDNVSGVGKHKSRGSEKDISLEIYEVVDSDVYNFSAILCNNKEIFMEIFWNTEETEIKFINNFSRKPSRKSQQRQEIITEVNISKGTDSNLVDMWTQGKPLVNSDLETDGDILTEYVSATQFSNRDYIIRSVGDWSATSTLDTSLQSADEYLVGTLLSGVNKEFVQYRKDHPNCGAFDESALSSPGWCLGQSVYSSNASTYTQDEIDIAWSERLIGYGIVKYGGLKSPAFTFDSNLCSSIEQ